MSGKNILDTAWQFTVRLMVNHIVEKMAIVGGITKMAKAWKTRPQLGELRVPFFASSSAFAAKMYDLPYIATNTAGAMLSGVPKELLKNKISIVFAAEMSADIASQYLPLWYANQIKLKRNPIKENFVVCIIFFAASVSEICSPETAFFLAILVNSSCHFLFLFPKYS